MTQAVCHNCGEIKFGAFIMCQSCKTTPSTDDDLALSLAMTDHYFDTAVLQQMSLSIKQGNPLHLDEKTRLTLLDQIRKYREIYKLPPHQHF